MEHKLKYTLYIYLQVTSSSRRRIYLGSFVDMESLHNRMRRYMRTHNIDKGQFEIVAIEDNENV